MVLEIKTVIYKQINIKQWDRSNNLKKSPNKVKLELDRFTAEFYLPDF
jgi:hypothetical protein